VSDQNGNKKSILFLSVPSARSIDVITVIKASRVERRCVVPKKRWWVESEGAKTVALEPLGRAHGLVGFRKCGWFWRVFWDRPCGTFADLCVCVVVVVVVCVCVGGE
jgi:hypothetical protein